MKVTLIDYTGAGVSNRRAAELLIYTKSTRLQMTPALLDDISSWPYPRILEELKYMANTIPSSWEFVDYTFQIEGVTRAFTHQFVRSRNVSFAQQTMRVLDVSEGRGWDYLTGPSIQENPLTYADDHGNDIALWEDYSEEMERLAKVYKRMIANGAKIEDARGILPTNILTNITAKMNMRTLVDLIHKRESSRTQGEYRDVLAAMKAAALEVHLWLSIFIEQDANKAVNDLERIINGIEYVGGTIPNEEKIVMIKLLDQIRRAL